MKHEQLALFEQKPISPACRRPRRYPRFCCRCASAVTYQFVNDKQNGQPAVTGVKRAYRIDADALTDHYGVPYSRQ